MINVRSVCSVCLSVVVAAGVALPTAGCGSGGAGTQAEVTPDFQKKTSSMLEQMSKDQMAKYKKKGTGGR
jgi:hypothetical protein